MRDKVTLAEKWHVLRAPPGQLPLHLPDGLHVRQDEDADVFWWAEEAIVKKGVTNSWDAYPNELTGTTESDNNHIGTYFDPQCDASDV
jgi:hypothetical protein